MVVELTLKYKYQNNEEIHFINKQMNKYVHRGQVCSLNSTGTQHRAKQTIGKYIICMYTQTCSKPWFYGAIRA